MIAPEIVLPRSVALLSVERLVLDNGLPVHIIEDAEQSVARLSLVWAAGSAVQSKPFVASTVLNLLAEGTERFSAREIAERLDFVGSYFDATLDRDYAVMTFCWLEKFFAPTLEVVSEVVLRPTFPADELDIYARKRMEWLALERAKPSTRAREAFAAALFGAEHPYGVSSPQGEYLNLTRDDLVGFHRQFYGADNCFAVCSIGGDAAGRKAILDMLAQIPLLARDKISPPCEGGVPQSGEGVDSASRSQLSTLNSQFSTVHVPFPDAVQSSIRIGRVLFPRQHPDFVGMQVVATVLGGYFGSRLVRNLREQRGYTYGVMSAMVNLRAAGYLAVSTEVAAEATEDAVAQIFAEMERLRTELVPQDELENVRRSMLGEVMRILDGPFGVVDVQIESMQLAMEGGDGGQEYINNFIRRVEAITPEDVHRLARQYLRREDFTVVVVGDTKYSVSV